jgi:hypothetical protein
VFLLFSGGAFSRSSPVFRFLPSNGAARGDVSTHSIAFSPEDGYFRRAL